MTGPSLFVLILKDLHDLLSASCQDVLRLNIDRLPIGSQRVTASRC
jgi:hypothetical protein